jgi:hypothetical protein
MSPASELLCSRVAQAAGYRPAGTAGAAEAFVLVEVPLPWPAKVETHPLVAPVMPLLQQHRARLQAVVPQGEPGSVVVYRRPPGPFTRFVRSEGTLDSLPDALGGTPRTVEGVTDVLVCTHGSRDRCCGSDGMRLYTQLEAMALPGVRLWRTSHTGGHRFAPTGLTFPDGRAWAWLDAEIVRRIVDRTLTPGEITAHDRGCAAFPDPFAQAAESAAFANAGWAWLDTARTAIVDQPANGGAAEVTVIGGDATYQAQVDVDRMVPVPECGQPLEESKKESPDLVVRRLDVAVGLPSAP